MDSTISSWLTDSEIIANLGQRIRARRLAMNRTQAELARETGLTKATIQKIESGKNSQLGSFVRIIRFFAEFDKLDSLLRPNISPQSLYENKSKPVRLRARKSHD